MAQNNTKKNANNKNEQNEEKTTNWLIPGILGAAVGAGLAYFFTKNQSQSHSEQPHSNSSSNYEAAPRGCCSICRDNYEATITLRCGHVLHKDCYDEMKRFNHREVLCPLCRRPAE